MWFWLRNRFASYLYSRHLGQGASESSTKNNRLGVLSPFDASAYSEIAIHRLDEQMAQIDAIDTKAAHIFLVSSTVLPISASLLTASDSLIQDCTASHVALAVGLVAYGAGCYRFIRAYRLSEWSRRPKLSKLQEYKEGKSNQEVMRWIGDQSIKSYYQNKNRIELKAKHVGHMIPMLALEALAIGIAVLIPLFF